MCTFTFIRHGCDKEAEHGLRHIAIIEQQCDPVRIGRPPADHPISRSYSSLDECCSSACCQKSIDKAVASAEKVEHDAASTPSMIKQAWLAANQVIWFHVMCCLAYIIETGGVSNAARIICPEPSGGPWAQPVQFLNLPPTLQERMPWHHWAQLRLMLVMYRASKVVWREQVIYERYMINPLHALGGGTHDLPLVCTQTSSTGSSDVPAPKMVVNRRSGLVLDSVSSEPGLPSDASVVAKWWTPRIQDTPVNPTSVVEDYSQLNKQSYPQPSSGLDVLASVATQAAETGPDIAVDSGSHQDHPDYYALAFLQSAQAMKTQDQWNGEGKAKADLDRGAHGEAILRGTAVKTRRSC